jgi:hypothetical protein
VKKRKPTASWSKYGFSNVQPETLRRRPPLPGPGNRKIRMTMPTVRLPPAYEEDDE